MTDVAVNEAHEAEETSVAVEATLTCKIGAAGSWRLGGAMVTVFSVFCCVLCVVVVCVRGSWFLGVRCWLISTTYQTMVSY
jgi:hypothetical protein